MNKTNIDNTEDKINTMFKTKNKMSAEEEKILNNLSRYLDTKFIYFGSIQRVDFFPGKSDIDVDVFTDNEYSTISKMKSYLNIPNAKVKKVVWRLQNGVMVSGYKINYKNEEKQISIEFSVYNEKYKREILKEHHDKTYNLPYYATFLLYLLKSIYYKFNILDKDTFSYLKKKILSVIIGLHDDEFVVLDKDHNITEQRLMDMFGKK
jgi:hypothetical protein